MNTFSSFDKAQQVVDIQNNVLRAISGQVHTDGISLTQIIKDREIEKLKELKDYFLKQELNFYQKNDLRDYRELLQKTIRWNNSNISKIRRNPKLVKDIIEYLNNVQNDDFFKNISNFVDEDIAPIILDDALDERGMFGELKKEIGDIAINALKTGLKGVSTNRSGYFSIDIITDSSSGEKSFKKLESTKGITITRNPKKGTIQVHFTHDIPNNKRNEILKALEQRTNKKREGTSITERYRGISQIINSFVRGLEIKPTILEAFENTILRSLLYNQEVNINRSANVIYGALDELYVSAFANFFGFSHRLTGYDILSEASKEIPVDIIFKGAGAQIKSYYEKDGIVGFNQYFKRDTEEAIPKQTSLYNFLTGSNQLQLSNPEVFGNFYFSEVYNRYNEDIAGDDISYKAIENRFDPIRTSINTYAQSALDKLLNFNHEIFLKMPDLIEDDLKDFDPGRPAFFFINGKPIPTSTMIDDIIEGLRDGDNIFIKLKDFSINTTPFSRTTERWPEAIQDPNVNSLLKASKVQYRIEVNVDGLIRKVLSKR